MKKNEILTTVINQFFVFDDENGNREDYTIDEFISYLNDNNSRKDLVIREISGENETWVQNEYRSSVTDISILLVLMYRYAKGYIKKAIKESSLHTADEFSFLITLMTFESLRKSELITKQIMEKTSGTEVINRLIANGMIAETADEKDKRSIRVSITKAGRDVIMEIIPLMSKVSDIIAGNLTDQEINSLAYLLKKLDYFHNDIYKGKKDLTLNDIWSEIAH